MLNRQHQESAKTCKKQNKTDHYSRPLENNGIVYAGTKNGLFNTADANTGKILRQHKAGNSSINKIIADKDGNVWISLIEGSLF